MQRSVWGRQMLLMVFTALGRPSFLGTTQNPQTLWRLDRRARSHAPGLPPTHRGRRAAPPTDDGPVSTAGDAGGTNRARCSG